MTRSGRMKPVQEVIGATERREAKHLADTEQKLAACEQKLAELMQYEEDYRKNFATRAAAGIGAQGLRDYQLFLARLAEAIRQQNRIVHTARAERDAQRGQWQEAARNHKAVDHVVDVWVKEERRHADRREQRESDERAQSRAQRKAD